VLSIVRDRKESSVKGRPVAEVEVALEVDLISSVGLALSINSNPPVSLALEIKPMQG
jgi:hypothetical protein